MPTNNPRGFVPVKNLNGATGFSVGPMRPTLGANADALWMGDIVELDVSGRVQRISDIVSGPDSGLPLGVIAQVFNSDGRPFTFNQPGAGPYIPVSTQGFVTVYEDPGIIFVANCSTTATYQDVGALIQVRVCAGVTGVGRSNMGVDLPGVNTAAGHFAKLYAVNAQDGGLSKTGLSGAANNDVEVLLVNTLWSNPFLRTNVGAPASGATG